jgi:hypothetical protein
MDLINRIKTLSAKLVKENKQQQILIPDAATFSERLEYIQLCVDVLSLGIYDSNLTNLIEQGIFALSHTSP